MLPSFNRHVYRILLGLVIFMLALGTVVYHVVEKFSWFNSYYFSVVTLATVGYGDLTPKTTFGKLFTTLYIFAGVGLITTFVGYSLRRRATLYARRHPERTSKIRKRTKS